MADILTRTRIAETGLHVPALGFGGGTLGDPDVITSEDQAQATLEEAWRLGIRYFDTAPWYGNTKSEHRIGTFLRQKPRSDFVISTKIGRVYFRPGDPEDFKTSKWMKRWAGGLPFDLRFDYTRDGILRSYEDSLTRLGLNRVDALVIHDLDIKHQQTEEGVLAALDQLDAGGGFQALADLKASGEIKAIGAGINLAGMIGRLLPRFPIDYFLVAMPYTLLDQPALDGDFDLCANHRASVVIGAVFASGILAAGHGQYGYQPADAVIQDRVSALGDVCRRHGVELPAAALQFPLAHPVVASVIPGANAPEQVTQNVSNFQAGIPDAFWADLKSENLLHPKAPTPV